MTPESLMELALKAAINSPLQNIRPNPRVGAALQTADGQVAVAAHEKYGSAHAEQKLVSDCLQKGWNLKGARIAVTLEPCNHFGKTPPCSKLLVKEGFSEVYIGAQDPNSKSQGGAEYLSNCGIKVVSQVLRDQCVDLNYEWLWAHKNKRPFIRIKMATSLDGRWTAEKNSENRFITSQVARQYAMGDREKAQIVITGAQTILDDKPAYTVRNLSSGEVGKVQPACWVLTRQGIDAEFVNSEKAFVKPAKFQNIECPVLNNSTTQYLKWDFKKDLFEKMYQQHELYSVMVESGPELTQKFLEHDLFDEVVVYLNSSFLGGTKSRHFKDPFGEGFVPGKKLIISSIKQLSSEDIVIRLAKP